MYIENGGKCVCVCDVHTHPRGCDRAGRLSSFCRCCRSVSFALASGGCFFPGICFSYAKGSLFVFFFSFFWDSVSRSKIPRTLAYLQSNRIFLRPDVKNLTIQFGEKGAGQTGTRYILSVHSFEWLPLLYMFVFISLCFIPSLLLIYLIPSFSIRLTEQSLYVRSCSSD